MNRDGFYCHDRLLETLDEVLKNSIGSFVDEICEADLKAIIDLLIFAWLKDRRKDITADRHHIYFVIEYIVQASWIG